MELSEPRRIWRDLNVVFARDANPQRRRFLDFIESARWAEFMTAEGLAR